jgi:hypothetical protein
MKFQCTYTSVQRPWGFNNDIRKSFLEYIKGENFRNDKGNIFPCRQVKVEPEEERQERQMGPQYTEVLTQVIHSLLRIYEDPKFCIGSG